MRYFTYQILLLLSLLFKSNAQCTGTLSGSTAVDDFTVSITMNCDTKKIQFEIEYTNYNNNWFGMVFHHSMVDHPSIVYTTGKNTDRPAALYSYDLQTKSASGVIYVPNYDWTEISTTMQPDYNDHTIKIIYEQDLNKTEFDTSTTSIGFRFATGTSLQLGMHNHKSAHAVVSLTDTPTTPLTTMLDASTTPQTSVSQTPEPTEPTMLDECGGNDDWSSNGVFDDFDILLTINCVAETIRLNITYNKFDNNWFGIVFNNEMEGNSVIYTTGKSGTMEPQLYFYDISGKSSDDLQYNQELNWNEIETATVNNGLRLIYEQDLSQTNWNINTNEILMRWAIGSSNTMRLTHHESRSTHTQYYNFISGNTTKVKHNMNKYIAHGIIMWIGWCVFASIGIMSSAFRWLFPNKPIGCWFKMHRASQIIVVLLHIIGLIVVIVAVDEAGVEHFFSNNHMIMGFTVTVLMILQPLNAWFRPHPADAGKKTPMGRLIWELMHKIFGYSAWILACITAFLGFSLPQIDEEWLGYVHLFGWCLFLFVVYVILMMIGCSQSKVEVMVPIVSIATVGSVNIDDDSTRESEHLVGGDDIINQI